MKTNDKPIENLGKFLQGYIPSLFHDDKVSVSATFNQIVDAADANVHPKYKKAWSELRHFPKTQAISNQLSRLVRMKVLGSSTHKHMQYYFLIEKETKAVRTQQKKVLIAV